MHYACPSPSKACLSRDYIIRICNIRIVFFYQMGVFGIPLIGSRVSFFHFNCFTILSVIPLLRSMTFFASSYIVAATSWMTSADAM